MCRFLSSWKKSRECSEDNEEMDSIDLCILDEELDDSDD